MVLIIVIQFDFGWFGSCVGKSMTAICRRQWTLGPRKPHLTSPPEHNFVYTGSFPYPLNSFPFWMIVLNLEFVAVTQYVVIFILSHLLGWSGISKISNSKVSIPELSS
ncbi:hypothetical protein RchiOBHm_Chr1g0314571 [Rosa chinensis]|uniref:Uncharacterized protein n=1 Tax=Rosa chinensis TaxID=74649 RepID=A0A2P6S768_ROSCH|nr:hypothetical protein RchiOBHm_Chr1g0314571 [Rosa chinensis]